MVFERECAGRETGGEAVPEGHVEEEEEEDADHGGALPLVHALVPLEVHQQFDRPLHPQVDHHGDDDDAVRQTVP